MFKLEESVTKQAIQTKFQTRHYESVKAVLSECIKQAFQKEARDEVRDWRLFSSFNRVLLQDSTTLGLDSSLSEFFPGRTHKGKLTATARIQTVYDLKQEEFIRFALQSYRDNDQKDASCILDLLAAGDLILRDLGYFSTACLLKIIAKAAFFVMPYQSGVKLYKEDGITELNLYKILVTNQLNCIDYKVCIGSENKVPIRIVAIKLSEEAKKKKIADAKKKASSTTKHSEEYYELLGWAIYITNVGSETWTIRDIGFAYRVRWRIETIFKAWKSSLKLKQIVHERKMCEYRCKIQLTIMLIYFSLLFKVVFAYFEIKVKEYFEKKAKYNPSQVVKYLSLMKLASLVHNIADILFKEPDWEKLIPLIIKATAYEKRKDRYNFETFMAYNNP